MGWRVGWLQEFYVLITSKLILGGLLTCDNVCVWEARTVVQLFDTHLGNGTGCITVTMAAPLTLTSN